MDIKLLEALVNQAGSIVLLAVILSRFRIFRSLLTQDHIEYRHLLFLGVFFGLFGIFKTYSGIPVHGALANARVVGVFVGGLIGGPVVGVLSGVIAGFHRWGIDIGGFTAFACMISTIVEGVMAGMLSKSFYRSERKWLFALYAGIAAEAIQMSIILLVVRPFPEAWDLVKIIGIPMIFANGIGISMFIAIVELFYNERDKIAASQSRTVLSIANETINLFRKGLTEETTKAAAQIIRSVTGATAVAFTSKDQILAHVGVGAGHHIVGSKIVTDITRKSLDEGKTKIAHDKKDIACEHKGCRLKRAIIVPLKVNNSVAGTLKIYKDEVITPVDEEIAEGLASLFSTQIELSRIDEQAKLLDQAELMALQAQINPHFLFNAINTIISSIRTSPDHARELLMKLGSYFRNSLNQPDEIDFLHEIENINNYLEIEKARFGNKIDIKYNIDENINHKIPPFTLQPLVENALKHGLLSRIEGGTIEINAVTGNEGNLRITVRDDGMGISGDKLSELLNDNIDSDSVGLKNVNKRLINKYGTASGLIINSSPGVGTEISMNIPG